MEEHFNDLIVASTSDSHVVIRRLHAEKTRHPQLGTLLWRLGA
jgi:hypothetical protein